MFGQKGKQGQFSSKIFLKLKKLSDKYDNLYNFIKFINFLKYNTRKRTVAL